MTDNDDLASPAAEILPPACAAETEEERAAVRRALTGAEFSDAPMRERRTR